MKFTRNSKKDERIKQQEGRNGVGFEAIANAIMNGGLVDVSDNHNQKTYLGQKTLFVNINNYIYRVPCRVRGDITHLITIHPSRKATKFYL